MKQRDPILAQLVIYLILLGALVFGMAFVSKLAFENADRCAVIRCIR